MSIFVFKWFVSYEGIESTTRLRKLENDLSSAMIPYKRQLVILCSANNDKTTTDLAYKAGKYITASLYSSRMLSLYISSYWFYIE